MSLHARLTSRTGVLAAAAWGFAEGTLFFVVPDVILTATALFSVKASLAQMGSALAGSLVAGLLMFGLAADHPAGVKDLVRHVPFVGERMFDKVESDFRESGVWALCKGPMSGVPYKVYAAEAPPHCNWFEFLLMSVPARLERFAGLWALFALIGLVFRGAIDARPAGAFVFHGLFWIASYSYYWLVI